MLLSSKPWIGIALGFSGVIAVAGFGCAGGTLGRVAGSEDLPTELTQEMKEKFEVTDLGAAPRAVLVTAQTPVPGTGPQRPSVAKRRGRKGKKGSVGPSPAAISPSPMQDPRAMASPSPLGQGAPSASSDLASDEVASPSVAPPAGPRLAYPSRRPAKEPIWQGEKMVFDITYFRMSAGDFTLEALPPKAIDGRKVYHVRGNAVSSPVFSLFYRLNDTVETFIDYEGLFSHRFHVVLEETKQSRDSLELYDSEKQQTFYWNRWNHKDRGFTETKEFKPIPPFSQDSLSALYYLRTVPLPDGAVIRLPVVSEGKSWEAAAAVLRREDCRTPMGKVRCIVIQPEMQYQGVLKKQGDSFLWLTDDDRRIVVKLEAKVRIGTVVAELKKFEPGMAPQ